MSRIKNIGIIGGGQLGRMLALAAFNMGYTVYIFSNIKNCPAAQVTPYVVVADYEDTAALDLFARKVEVVTIEFENIPPQTLAYLAGKVRIHPHEKVLYITQNRIREKEFINSLRINTVDYRIVTTRNSLSRTISTFPALLKTAELGYDGKGQYLLTRENVGNVPLTQTMILEQYIDIYKELSIVIARNARGQKVFFPIAENIHRNNILHTSRVPAEITSRVQDEIKDIADRIVEALDIVGILAIEFFLTHDHRLLVNELAPRPHNSAHWSIDACNISQFAQLIRVICDLPLQEVVLRFPCKTINLLGEEVNDIAQYLNDYKATIHLYGKDTIRANRKMGHVNLRI